MKLCNSAARRLLLSNGFEAVGLPHKSMNLLRPASLSYVNHNNEHNVGAPPPRSPPKVQISLDDPGDELFNKGDYRTGLDADNSHRKTEDVTGFVANKAKSGTKSAVETAFNAGEAVAEGMEKTWGGIKETTQKIKDSVLGDNDDHDNINNQMNNNSEMRYGGSRGDLSQGNVDKVHVKDFRRKAGDFNQRFH